MTTTTDTSTDVGARTARNLHQVANLVHALRHRLPFLPYVTASHDGATRVSWYTAIHVNGEQATVEATEQIREAIGGTWDEKVTDVEASFTRQFGDLELTITCAHVAEPVSA